MKKIDNQNFQLTHTTLYLYLGFIRVTSTGLDATSPHCSWHESCEYTANTKQECAEALCKASGYPVGLFVKDSNNFCTSSFTTDTIWVYELDTKVISKETSNNEAQITADCQG